MFISVRIVVVIIELFLEWFRLSVTSFCLFSHTLSFISSTLVVTGKQILLLLLLLKIVVKVAERNADRQHPNRVVKLRKIEL